MARWAAKMMNTSYRADICHSGYSRTVKDVTVDQTVTVYSKGTLNEEAAQRAKTSSIRIQYGPGRSASSAGASQILSIPPATEIATRRSKNPPEPDVPIQSGVIHCQSRREQRSLQRASGKLQCADTSPFQSELKKRSKSAINIAPVTRDHLTCIQ